MNNNFSFFPFCIKSVEDAGFHSVFWGIMPTIYFLIPGREFMDYLKVALTRSTEFWLFEFCHATEHQ